MSFLWPVMLVWLLLVPLFVVVYSRMQQRRQRLAKIYGGTGGSQGSAGAPRGVRRHIPAALYLAGLTILIVALARPQTIVSLPRLEGTVMLAFDVSGSMAADDLEPTRFDAAKAAARDFVERQPSTVQVGVVSFSEGGFATQPPTSDQAAILAAINRLSLQSSTSLASGMQAALNAIAAGSGEEPLTLSDRTLTATPTPTPVPRGTYIPAVIVLLTDGENTADPDPFETAQIAADRGIRVYTVGVGSAEGATLQLDGFTVRTRLDETTLQQIAELTGGTYYNAENEEELHMIYDQLSPELVLRPQKTEVTSLFAGASLLVMLIGGSLSLLWLGRLP